MHEWLMQVQSPGHHRQRNYEKEIGFALDVATQTLHSGELSCIDSSFSFIPSWSIVHCLAPSFLDLNSFGQSYTL